MGNFRIPEVDEIAVVNQFANERVDVPHGKLWSTFEIATNEAEFMHAIPATFLPYVLAQQ